MAVVQVGQPVLHLADNECVRNACWFACAVLDFIAISIIKYLFRNYEALANGEVY